MSLYQDWEKEKEDQLIWWDWQIIQEERDAFNCKKVGAKEEKGEEH